ncbi:hypothetical protein SK128_003107, partial [Halocaridina rubra]
MLRKLDEYKKSLCTLVSGDRSSEVVMLASHIAKTPDPTLKTAFRRNLRSILGDPADFLADRSIPVPVGSASYVR